MGGETRWGTLLIFLGACTPLVDVGTAGNTEDCSPSPPPASCPLLPWTPLSSAAADGLRGRWRLCGGRRHASCDTVTTFFGSQTIELIDSPEGWRLTLLEQASPTSGTARYEPTSHRLAFTTAEGDEAVWQVALFEAPKVLRLSALDAWDFVPLE